MIKLFSNKNKLQNGQVMLLAVLLIGSSVLVLTTVAGYLMLQRMKIASIIVDSTKAIYAADTGISCELYNLMKGASVDCNTAISFNTNLTSVNTIKATGYVKAVGTSNKSKRAFYVGY